MTNKMTNKGALNFVIENCVIPSDVKEKLEKMVVALEKKASADRKPTKAQAANAELKAEILDLMEENHVYTVTELMKAVSSEVSNQKVSALLRQLKEDGLVVRTEEKGKAYFSKVSA